MSRFVENEEYLNTEEVRAAFENASKKRFYNNIKPHLRVYRFDAKRTPWYKKQEVLALASGKPIRKATIAITGMFVDWTEYARSLGFNAQTINRAVEVGPLPEDIAATFHLSTDQQFVKRGRMTFIDRTPICSWDTYYPLSLVQDILPQMQQGTASNIVEHIRDKHGVTISNVHDRYSARITTFEEQNLFELLNDEPVLVLQRLSWTHDQKVLVLFSDMTLLGSWFVIERDQLIHDWDK